LILETENDKKFIIITAGQKITRSAVAEPDQGHPSPPRNEVRGPASPNFPKHRWFQNVIHNI